MVLYIRKIIVILAETSNNQVTQSTLLECFNMYLMDMNHKISILQQMKQDPLMMLETIPLFMVDLCSKLEDQIDSSSISIEDLDLVIMYI